MLFTLVTNILLCGCSAATGLQMSGSTITTDDSRSDASDHREPRRGRTSDSRSDTPVRRTSGRASTKAKNPVRPTRMDRRRSFGANSSGKEKEDPPHQPVHTKEYIKWRNNADKFVARAQKEMFDLMEESFTRQFPSRQGAMELQPSASDPGGPKPIHQPAEEEGEVGSKRRRKPNNPEPYEGAPLRRPRQEGASSAYPDSAQPRRRMRGEEGKRTAQQTSVVGRGHVPTGQDENAQRSKRRKSLQSETQPSVETQADKEGLAPSVLDKQVRSSKKGKHLQAETLRTLIYADDAEKTLEEIAPGITRNLSKEEMLNLLRISKNLPQWNETALSRQREKRSDEASKKEGVDERDSPQKAAQRRSRPPPERGEDDQLEKENQRLPAEAPPQPEPMDECECELMPLWGTKSAWEGPSYPHEFESQVLREAVQFETLKWQGFSGSSDASSGDKRCPVRLGGKEEEGPDIGNVGRHLEESGGRDGETGERMFFQSNWETLGAGGRGQVREALLLPAELRVESDDNNGRVSKDSKLGMPLMPVSQHPPSRKPPQMSVVSMDAVPPKVFARLAPKVKTVLNPDPYKGRNLLVPPGTDITKYRKPPKTDFVPAIDVCSAAGRRPEVQEGPIVDEQEVPRCAGHFSRWDTFLEERDAGQSNPEVEQYKDSDVVLGGHSRGQSPTEAVLPSCPPEGCQSRSKQQFQDAIELFEPPQNLYEISAGLIRWSWTEREKALRLKNDSPELLKASLRHWILTAMSQSPTKDPESLSTRRLGHIIYGLRGLRIQEFVELMKAQDFAMAVFELTGIRVGHNRQDMKTGGHMTSGGMAAGPGVASRLYPVPGNQGEQPSASDKCIDKDELGDPKRAQAGNAKNNTSSRVLYSTHLDSLQTLEDADLPPPQVKESRWVSYLAPPVSPPSSSNAKKGSGASLSELGQGPQHWIFAVPRQRGILPPNPTLAPCFPLLLERGSQTENDPLSHNTLATPTETQVEGEGGAEEEGLQQTMVGIRPGGDEGAEGPESSDRVGKEAAGEESVKTWEQSMKLSPATLPNTGGVSRTSGAEQQNGLSTGIQVGQENKQLRQRKESEEYRAERSAAVPGERKPESGFGVSSAETVIGETGASVLNEDQTVGKESPPSSRMASSVLNNKRVIDITTDTQESGEATRKGDQGQQIGLHGSQSSQELQQMEATESSSEVALERQLSPMDRFARNLGIAVCLPEIARLYGLDAVKMEAQAQGDENCGESKTARADLAVLQGIVQYLNRQRTSSVKWSGTEFVVVLNRIPCRILTIEQQRFDELHRTNHKCSHLYANYKQGTIFRCPLPECGGATINQNGIKKTLVAHHKAYHRDLSNIQFTYKIETVRGWDYLSIPERANRGSLAPPVSSFAQEGVSGRADGGQGGDGRHLNWRLGTIPLLVRLALRQIGKFPH